MPQRLRLGNGLTVVLDEHRAADVVAVQLWMRVGARDEADDESGLSHFIEHLLFKGTPARGPGVIDRTISGLGGEINAATSQDFTYYRIVLPARHVDIALKIVADAARHAVFEPEDLERERLVVLEEIRRTHDSPGTDLWRVLLREHFAGHPYARPVLGTAETIRRVPRERIVDYHRRCYVPSRATIVVVGAVDRDDVLTRAERAFAHWDAPHTREPEPVRPPALVSARRASEERSVQQVYMGIAWRGPTVPRRDVYAVDLLASILGRGRSSRLNQALRERAGLVSAIGASFYAQHDAGTVSVTARTEAARRERVEAALLAEVDRLRRTLVGRAELERARTAAEAGHAFAAETAEGVAYAYGLAETLWTLEFELGYLDELRKVTRERVRGAARRYLDPGRYTAAVLMPGGGPP